ncbi:BRO family protein [Fusobacterium necrophorum]|uniref:BRO family protein n=1 Tax=Fusobacterium necrophorum TaxID=859 RepID=UPI00370E56F2
MNQLITTQMFEGMTIDVYRSEDNFLFTMEQISRAMEYSEASLIDLIIKNPHLRDKEFSFLMKVDSLEGGILKKREKRFFTEDGLYEVAFKARTKKAEEFRKFVRTLLKRLRKGELTVPSNMGIVNQQADQILLQMKELTEKMDNDQEEKIIPMLERIVESYEETKERLDKIEEKMKKMETSIQVSQQTIEEIMEMMGE